jgi:hypothetical protein
MGDRGTVVGESGSVSLDGLKAGRKTGESELETSTWAVDEDRIDVQVVGGSKTIEVVDRP